MVLIESADGTGSTLLDNAGAYYPEHILLNNYYHQSMLCLKAFLIPAESCILRWLGYDVYQKRQLLKQVAAFSLVSNYYQLR
jgi:hypothetical protein